MSAAGRPATSARTRQSAGATWAVDQAVRGRMQRQQTRDTAPEIALRRLLHAAGLRYRVDTAPLPRLRRRADVVFSPSRVAVFVDGCFWHGCPDHGSTPKSHSDYWDAKLRRNRERDADRALLSAGWEVVRAWEHDDPATTAARVVDAVEARRPPYRRGGGGPLQPAPAGAPHASREAATPKGSAARAAQSASRPKAVERAC